eukprot:Ihof_evm4s50 gene=Ihof_evmTU4s50
MVDFMESETPKGKVTKTCLYSRNKRLMHAGHNSICSTRLKKVSFNERVETYDTYELYRSYFSEYDRRPVKHNVRLTEGQVRDIQQE